MSDMLFGGIILIGFLIVVFIAGYFLYRIKNARLTGEWGALPALVNGKVVGDGGGGVTSWLVGTYQGRKVQASIVPDHNMYSDEVGGSGPGERYNYFELALDADVPGRRDWAITYSHKLLGLGQEGWGVRSDDPAAESALDDRVLPLLIPFGAPPRHLDTPILEYRRNDGLLRYRADITPRRAPTPEHFTQLLDMLQRVAEINRGLTSP